jgi:hypothetical protein
MKFHAGNMLNRVSAYCWIVCAKLHQLAFVRSASYIMQNKPYLLLSARIKK